MLEPSSDRSCTSRPAAARRGLGDASPAPELAPDRIELWLTFFEQIQDERLLKQYRQLLSEEERREEQRFRRAPDRHCYVVTRALVRTVLSRYAPVAPHRWVFRKNAYGRPGIDHADAAATRIAFNLSHTPGLIVLGVTCGSDIGVDAENVRVRRAPLEAQRTVLAPGEISALAQLPAAMQHDRFFEYWTLKESYIKARGMGIGLPLQQVCFDLSQQDRIELSTDQRLNDPAARWCLWQWRLRAGYLVAVCAERNGAGRQQLIGRAIVPLRHERMLDCIPQRQSS